VVLAGALQGGRARAERPDAANGRIRNSSVGEEGLELEPRMVEEGGVASSNSSAVGEGRTVSPAESPTRKNGEETRQREARPSIRLSGASYY
jgi:hypothetical protein